MQGFIQDFYLGWGNVDACKGCMRASVHLLGFFVDLNEILDIFKDNSHQIQL